MSAQDETIQVGQVLGGRHRIISEGAPHDLGMLYKAYDMRRDQMSEALIIARRFGSGVEVLDRVVRINRAVKDLQQPLLIPFEHAGLITGQIFLVRAQTQASPLADLLAQVGSLDMEAAVDIATRLCETLMPLHRAGLVHGGLSPQSVLVRVDNQNVAVPASPDSAPRPLRTVSVIDVGLLPALRPPDAPPALPWGRFPYLSPEQAAGEDIHSGSDVYVIGSLLYEMLSGRPPFRASDEMILALQHLRQDPPSLQVLVPRAPPALVQIVQKALAKEPAARYRNAGQLAYIMHAQVPQLAGSQLVSRPRPPAQERLVVPPPPAPTPPTTAPSAPVVYDAGTVADYQTDDSGEMDWILVGLVVAALVTVLGLILLWRTVYKRYTVPPQVPVSSSYRLPESELDRTGQLVSLLTETYIARSRSEHARVRALGGMRGCSLLDLPALASHGPELDQARLVWYNPETPGSLRLDWCSGIFRIAPEPVSIGYRGTSSLRAVRKLPVWESSLRVSGPKYNKL